MAPPPLHTSNSGHHMDLGVDESPAHARADSISGKPMSALEACRPPGSQLAKRSEWSYVTTVSGSDLSERVRTRIKLT